MYLTTHYSDWYFLTILVVDCHQDLHDYIGVLVWSFRSSTCMLQDHELFSIDQLIDNTPVIWLGCIWIPSQQSGLMMGPSRMEAGSQWWHMTTWVPRVTLLGDEESSLLLWGRLTAFDCWHIHVPWSCHSISPSGTSGMRVLISCPLLSICLGWWAQGSMSWSCSCCTSLRMASTLFDQRAWCPASHCTGCELCLQLGPPLQVDSWDVDTSSQVIVMGRVPLMCVGHIWHPFRQLGLHLYLCQQSHHHDH